MFPWLAPMAKMHGAYVSAALHRARLCWQPSACAGSPFARADGFRLARRRGSGPSITSSVISVVAMRGQGMHDDGVGLGQRDERRIDAIGREDGAALLGLGLLAHARPDIGVEHIRACCRRLGVVHDGDAAARRARLALRLGDQRGVGLIARGGGDADVHPQLGGGLHQ